MLKTIVAVSVVVALQGIALAQSSDPKILTTPDALTLPLPVTDIQDVQPCASTDTTCQYNFINTTGEIIDSLTFDVTFANGIPVGASFSVEDTTIPQSENCGGYFLNCSANVSGNTVDFSFSGVNPADGDEAPGQPNSDKEIGQQEGIPPQAGFFITLEGWTGDFSNNVSFQNSFTTVPEASTGLILVIELLVLACIVGILRRKVNWKQRLNC